MANRYWVGGTATWDATVGTKWSATSGGAGGASVPTSSDAVFFDQASTYTVTLSGSLSCASLTVSAGSVTFTSTGTLAINGDMTLNATTTWSATGTISWSGTSTITTNGVTINSTSFQVSGTEFRLGSALTLGDTTTFTHNSGGVYLDNFNLTTGIYSSSNSTTRLVNFGTGYITLAHTTAGTIVVSMNTMTN